MPIVVAEVSAQFVRLLHKFLSFREGVNRNIDLSADKASNNILTNLVPIMHAANFFIEAQLS